MAYTKTTDFATKDTLLSGNPAKLVKGVEIDDEFNALQVADADNTKGPSSTVDNAVARYDGTTGKLIQNSGVTIDDSNVMTVPSLVATTADINGGTIDGTTVGATTPAAGTFTTLTSTGNATLGDAEATDTHAIKGATTLAVNSASAALTITQTGAGNALVVEDETSPDSSPFVVTSSGTLVVGTTTPQSVSGLTPAAQIVGATSGTSQLQIMRFSNDAPPPGLNFRKSRASIGGNTIVNASDTIGSIGFWADDGTTQIKAAGIDVVIDGTPGANDIPGALAFSTTADGASSATERMRIANGGTTTIGGTSAAPALSVIPVASQTRWVTVTGSNGGNPTISTSAGGLQLGTSGGPSLLLQNVASAVNYVQINPSAAAGGFVSVLAVGSDADISLFQTSKGAGNVVFYTGSLSAAQVAITHTASANRYITLTGSNGANPKISTSAGSLDIGAPLVLTSQTVGTTVGAAGGASALPATPLGYITTNINGTACKIPYYNT